MVPVRNYNWIDNNDPPCRATLKIATPPANASHKKSMVMGERTARYLKPKFPIAYLLQIGRLVGLVGGEGGGGCSQEEVVKFNQSTFLLGS